MSKARSSSERVPKMDPLGAIAAMARGVSRDFQYLYKSRRGGENHARK
jgi:hypothetical protein